MRVTVDLDEDVVAAIERLRMEAGSMEFDEVVNQLVRAAVEASKGDRLPFKQRTQSIGLKIDVTNVAEALEIGESLDPPSVGPPRSGPAK